jgi:hypothetical protein
MERRVCWPVESPACKCSRNLTFLCYVTVWVDSPAICIFTRVLQQLAASEPFAFADVAAALVADHDVLRQAASALREARAFGGLRGPASAAQGAAVHVLRILSALALSPAICLATDGASALPDLLAALRELFVEDAGGGGDGAAPPAAAVYAAAGELVARLLALDEGGAAGAALRSSALEVGDALEAWWAEQDAPG